MAKYQKLDQRTHVLRRPGMYIGSVDRQSAELWLWKEGGMIFSEVEYSPGLAHIFLEVLTNAVDHSFRTKVTEIRVDIDRESGSISVWNDGTGIDCSMTSEKIRGPELIFGHFLSGSNFEDTGERTVAGAHGIGAKASNAFSREFFVETLDATAKPKILYKQRWRDNMSVVEPATLERLSGKQKPFTRVVFTPDYARFGSDGLDDDTLAVLSKHVVDASAVTPPQTAVYLNGERIPCKSFKDYCSLYSDAVAYDSVSRDDWEVAVAESPDGSMRQVSFVNGLCTPRGGKHVDHVATAIAKKLSARLSTKAKAVTNKTVRNAMWVFVKARVPDPMFDSQNKQTLTTPIEKFKSRYEAGDAFLKLILSKTEIGNRVQRLGVLDDENKLKKTDGSLRKTVTGIPNFDDAHAAGTSESHKCTLILTEGLSARSTAVAGLAAIGRRYYGVMALKGKPLNPRDTSTAKIGENEEIKNLKKAMGLESGKTYDTAAERATMRYGRVQVAADSDLDGVHICALVCNIFHALWPSLLRIPGFVSSLRTPVVVGKKGKQTMPFYSLSAFEAWRDSDASKGWSAVYYKGLGLINSAEAREYFGNPKLYRFVCSSGDGSGGCDPALRVRLIVTAAGRVKLRIVADDLPKDDDDAFELAFRKTRAEDRKEWLNTFDKHGQLPDDTETVSMKDYVSRELCHYSWDDVQRSLPHVVDGLKESTRKILFALKTRPANASHIRVAQMAAYVGQVSAYRHGEASLTGAIVGMAQDYVGCGHVQLVHGEGQFGTRIVGGKDAASSRYIHCDASRVAELMFPSDDEPMLQRNVDDDNKPIEACYYIPVLPLLLLNGSVGIGTGWSCNVPCFDPATISEAYSLRIKGDLGAFALLRDAPPCYRGFRGTFHRLESGKWVSRGVAVKSGKTIRVTELPIGTWLSDYKVFLEQLVSNNKIGLKRIESNYTDTRADYTLHFDTVASASACDVNADLKLESDKLMTMTNMHALDTLKGVRRYETAADIAEEHYHERRKAYDSRLVYQRNAARRDLAFAEAKEGFVRAVVKRDLEIGLAPESLISEFAEAKGWPREEHKGYDYLSSLPISSMTQERLERLVRDVERKQQRLEELMAATVESLWLAEIDAVTNEIAARC